MPGSPLTDDDAMELALAEARLAEHPRRCARRRGNPGGRAGSGGAPQRARADRRPHGPRRAAGPPGHGAGHRQLAARTTVTLVVTLEPCPMCAGAVVASRLGRLVFGATDPRAGACGTLYNLCADPRLNHETPITAGIRAAECGALLTSFFADKRTPRTS